MKLFAALALVLFASSAQAVTHHSEMVTCHQAQKLLKYYGVLDLYIHGRFAERFVKHPSQCGRWEARPGYGPTLDNYYCRLGYTCHRRHRPHPRPWPHGSDTDPGHWPQDPCVGDRAGCSRDGGVG